MDDVKAPVAVKTEAKAEAPKHTVAYKIETKELFEFGPSGWKSTKDAHVEVLSASPKRVKFFRDWTEASKDGHKK